MSLLRNDRIIQGVKVEDPFQPAVPSAQTCVFNDVVTCNREQWLPDDGWFNSVSRVTRVLVSLVSLDVDAFSQ